MYEKSSKVKSNQPPKNAARHTLCPIATGPLARQTLAMRIVPPDEYSSAVAYLRRHGCNITPEDSLTCADVAAPRTKVDGTALTAEEVVSLAIEKGWELP
jgi:hypothetical protein